MIGLGILDKSGRVGVGRSDMVVKPHSTYGHDHVIKIYTSKSQGEGNGHSLGYA